MRAQILSDLHLEFEGNSIPPLAPGAEIVLFAGDLAPVHARRIGMMAQRWDDARHVLFVPGNHEYYGSEIDRARRTLAEDCIAHGVTLLDPGAVTIGSTRFVGATLWTDFRLDGGPSAEVWAHLDVSRGLNDFLGAIRHGDSPFTTRESARRHAADLAFIERELEAAQDAGQNAVVLTHHAPSPICVRPQFAGDRLNAGFASDLDSLIRHYRPLMWIHGHMHARVEETVGRTRILANPAGYGAAEQADFDPALVVDLPD